MMGGNVAEAVIVGSFVRVGWGVREVVGVGLSWSVGQGVGVPITSVGKASVGGSVGSGAKASSKTSQPAIKTISIKKVSR
jgi:hypothetical protein